MEKDITPEIREALLRWQQSKNSIDEDTADLLMEKFLLVEREDPPVSEAGLVLRYELTSAGRELLQRILGAS